MEISTARYLLAALFIAGLTACSSKPSSTDIQKEMVAAFDCPILELSEVNKVDGAAVSDNLYDVSFTYTLGVKGGQTAATKLLSEYAFLADQRDLAIKIRDGAMLQRDKQKEQTTSVLVSQIISRMNTLQPCRSPLATSRIGVMLVGFESAAKSGQEKISAPWAEKIYGQGRMRKSESGWRFIGMPHLILKETVKSEPVDYPKFNPLVTEDVQGSATEKAITARGKLISGRQDSILEGENGEGPSFMTQSAVAKAIFAVCGDGDICEVQGKVDPRDGFLTSVSSVKKIK